MNYTWRANTDGIPGGEMDNNNLIKKKVVSNCDVCFDGGV